MEHILHKINPIHNVISYFFKIHLNVIRFSTHNSPKPSYFLQIFVTHYIISRLFHTCCMHTNFITVVMISGDYQL